MLLCLRGNENSESSGLFVMLFATLLCVSIFYIEFHSFPYLHGIDCFSFCLTFKRIAELGGGKYEAAVYAAQCSNLKRMLPICTDWEVYTSLTSSYLII